MIHLSGRLYWLFCPFRCHSGLSSVNTLPLQLSLCPFFCKNSALLLFIWPFGLSLFPYSCHSALSSVKTSAVNLIFWAVTLSLQMSLCPFCPTFWAVDHSLQMSLCHFFCKSYALLLSTWPFGLSLFPYSCHSALSPVKTRSFCCQSARHFGLSIISCSGHTAFSSAKATSFLL